MPKIRLIRWADTDVQFDFDLDNNNDDEWVCAHTLAYCLDYRTTGYGP